MAKGKTVWGFGGNKSRITIGENKPEEVVLDEELLDTPVDDSSTDDATDEDSSIDEAPDFESMTKKELLAFANENDIEVDSSLKVGEIREAIAAEFE